MIALPVDQVEKKLSQMILDRKLSGILDQGDGVLILFEPTCTDSTYEASLETIQSLGKVVDTLYQKAKKLTWIGEEEKVDFLINIFIDVHVTFFLVFIFIVIFIVYLFITLMVSLMLCCAHSTLVLGYLERLFFRWVLYYTNLTSTFRCIMLPKFDASTVWSNLLGVNMSNTDRPTIFMGVPTIYSKLVDEYEKKFETNPKLKEYVKNVCSSKVRWEFILYNSLGLTEIPQRLGNAGRDSAPLCK